MRGLVNHMVIFFAGLVISIWRARLDFAGLISGVTQNCHVMALSARRGAAPYFRAWSQPARRSPATFANAAGAPSEYWGALRSRGAAADNSPHF